MEKVVYLLGAGASYGRKNRRSLPIVNEIPEFILNTIENLKGHRQGLNGQETFGIDNLPNFNYALILDEIIKDLQWLHDNSINHSSIDTFAKKLSIKNDTELLEKLKITTSIFFTILQVTKPVDLRYDAFLASIMKSLSHFPNNIKILSWNYDHQLETAYSDFREINLIPQLQFHLNTYSKYNENSNENHLPNEFGYYKLNGIAAFGDVHGFKNKYFLEKVSKSLTIVELKDIITAFQMYKIDKKASSLLSFAWEEEKTKSIVSTAKEGIKNATVLVIIGYSFPFFNREVDRELFKDLKTLKKIYIQDYAPENIKPRVTELFSKHFEDQESSSPEIIPYEDITQFLVPPEL
jgi:hypothetical protein